MAHLYNFITPWLHNIILTTILWLVITEFNNGYNILFLKQLGLLSQGFADYLYSNERSIESAKR